DPLLAATQTRLLAKGAQPLDLRQVVGHWTLRSGVRRTPGRAHANLLPRGGRASVLTVIHRFGGWRPVDVDNFAAFKVGSSRLRPMPVGSSDLRAGTRGGKPWPASSRSRIRRAGSGRRPRPST